MRPLLECASKMGSELLAASGGVRGRDWRGEERRGDGFGLGERFHGAASLGYC